MAQRIREGGSSGIRYFLGDICDYDRLCLAMKGCDIVIHAAAMKMIDACEYNVLESIKNNVLGTENVVRACLENNVSKAIFVSSDKACDPISTYGAEKFLGERIFINSNNYGKCKFNCVRYGNVIGSNKSVFHLWDKQAIAGETLTVTHHDMTRFFWMVSHAADFIINKIPLEDRGVVYIPKMKSFRIIDIARSYSPDVQITGLRCSEKLHERLVSEVEVEDTYDRGDYYVIYPKQHPWVMDLPKDLGTKVSSSTNFTSSDYSKWSKE
jgi:UDP-N-acetylglucosamine 4,6-dehydratase